MGEDEKNTYGNHLSKQNGQLVKRWLFLNFFILFLFHFCTPSKNSELGYFFQTLILY